MAYTIKNMEVFTVLGIGTQLIAEQNENFYAEIARQKGAHVSNSQNALARLTKNANSDETYYVNEAVNGEMWYYVGVASDDAAASDVREIVFPAGKYLVISDQADSRAALSGQLEGQAFGQVLPNLDDFAYVGGPNAVVIKNNQSNQITGEIIIPVVAK
ncbi:transcriptional regulator [Weissella cibaria]|uniref:effector binding domain-containing protein n=1 Tax=Weissella cibaria TaxID=137591 RepID=UPI0011973475|nr:effector binding domain-containing protein [Weissella cibaria]MCT8398114.1 transcriptional regulator [Weissella cibaria]MCT8401313.1 transcriptional regulator [Weissella cibaria]TVV25637.1 transcriptional regulator [Weissella cibaria]